MSRYYNDYLEHYGVQGMKWGIRKYQNADGTLTAEGYKRYGKNADAKNRKVLLKEGQKAADTNRKKVIGKMDSEYKSSKEYKATQKATEHYNKIADDYRKAWDGRNLVDKRRADRANLDMAEWEKNEYVPIRKAAEKKIDSLIDKYADDYSGALLRDMGREDTAAGRKYIRDIDLARIKVYY